MLLGDLLSVAWASDRVRLVRPRRAWSDVRICDLTEDSRTVVPGSLFIARPGTAHDGAAFLEEAIEAGAVAVLVPTVLVEADDAWMSELLERVVVIAADDPGLESAALAERFYGRPTDRLAVVGVTGTNGKSTVAHVTQQLLARRGSPCGLIGTIEIDDGTERVPATLTTPPAIELSRTFGVMLESGCHAAVMEVSSHALAQGRAAAVRFDAAVFTNLGTDHVDYHGSVETYLEAKLGLFRMLGPAGVTVVNIDDPNAAAVIRAGRAGRADGAGPGRLIRCTMNQNARVDQKPDRDAEAVATLVSADASGSEILLRGPWGELTARTPLLGSHNAMNLLQATSAAWAIKTRAAHAHCSCTSSTGSVTEAQRLEIERRAADELSEALGSVTAPPGRLEPMHEPGDAVSVIVDYAHTPDAYELTINAVRAVMAPTSRLTVVFGCGGEREPTKRPLMGQAAVNGADRVVISTDNPRSERPGAIISDIMAPMTAAQKSRVVVHVDRTTAVEHAIHTSETGDVVLLLGKGHETYQWMPTEDGRVIAEAYDERATARAALASRRRSGRPVIGVGEPGDSASSSAVFGS